MKIDESIIYHEKRDENVMRRKWKEWERNEW